MSDVVILGGSFTGLAAALMLACDGHEVTVLERDSTSLSRTHDEWKRPTVPQVRQAHSTMALGRAILARRLPDVLSALLANGAFGGRPLLLGVHAVGDALATTDPTFGVRR
ncbi:FAD-dependent oxidoreductase [Kutzneria sp. NPDC052558]|uniref:FAD-dependent oxidoreductase n=1 Tax=Kutzneria sp. NPDC052558 TaxID=3364121 RepID=UPI0037CB8468